MDNLTPLQQRILALSCLALAGRDTAAVGLSRKQIISWLGGCNGSRHSAINSLVDHGYLLQFSRWGGKDLYYLLSDKAINWAKKLQSSNQNYSAREWHTNQYNEYIE